MLTSRNCSSSSIFERYTGAGVGFLTVVTVLAVALVVRGPPLPYAGQPPAILLVSARKIMFSFVLFVLFLCNFGFI